MLKQVIWIVYWDPLMIIWIFFKRMVPFKVCILWNLWLSLWWIYQTRRPRMGVKSSPMNTFLNFPVVAPLIIFLFLRNFICCLYETNLQTIFFLDFPRKWHLWMSFSQSKFICTAALFSSFSETLSISLAISSMIFSGSFPNSGVSSLRWTLQASSDILVVGVAYIICEIYLCI